MGLFKSIRNALSIEGDSLSDPSGWLRRLLAFADTSSGVAISEGNALTVSDFYKCDRVLRETVAMLPWKLYQTQTRGRKEAKNHPLYFILHDEPNDHMTSFTYREMMMSNLNIWGRHFSYIERDRAGRVRALWPMRPDLCRLQVIDGQVWFFVRPLGGGPELKFWDDEVLYIPGLTRDGYYSYSPVVMQREALGLAKAMEIFGAKFFGNGTHTNATIDHPATISKEAATRLKEQFEERHSGLENAHRIMVLEEGMKFSTNAIPNDTAQFLESREFQRGEIAGIMRVPPHKIGDLSRSTNNNIEHQDLEFLRDSIAPWLERIEQACNRRLLLPAEKGRFYVEFEIKGMMRGDTAARTAYYAAMFNTAAYSPNMILESENDEPFEGGDEHFVPMNMVPISKIDQIYKEDDALNPEGEPLQTIRRANTAFFKDAVGRVLNRKPTERKKYAETAFLQPVRSLIECLLGSVSKPMGLFAEAHAASIAELSAGWQAEKSDEIASQEVDRCIKEVLARGAN